MSQAWLVERERANVAALRILVWIRRRLGRALGRAVLFPVCVYFVIFAPKARAASHAYLSRVFDRPPSLRDVFRHFLVFATVALDRVQFLAADDTGFEFHVQGEEELRTRIASGRGCFLLGAHLGSFEALRLVGRRERLRVCLVMYEENARNVARVTRAVNPELEKDVIALGSPDSILKVADRLNQGSFVGILGDRALYDGAQVPVPFFGATARFPTAPFRIAAMTGVPIVFMVGLYRGGNRYDLCFETLVESPRLERATRDETIRNWVALYASRLEYYCRLAPYNWFNFYDFWSGNDSKS